jgi:hypothetical protein
MPDTGALVGIDINLDCLEDMSLVLSGPVEVERQAAVGEHIDTEIVSMELTGSGVTLRVGVSTPGIDPAVPSTSGAIDETAGDPALADSFFHVWFEVDGVPGGPVYNHTPLTLSAVIDRVPPEVVYLHPGPLCLPLYDDPIAGTHLYNLVRADHDTRGPIGGIGELPDIAGGAGDRSVSSGGSASPPYAAIAAALAAAAVALVASGWYARRRWMR